MATRGWEHATPMDTRHRRSLVPAKASKYHAQPTVVDGVRFASKRESERYTELKMLEKAGSIRNLRLQPRFPLHVQPIAHDEHPVYVGTYVADFQYEELAETGGRWDTEIEDVKGVKTPIYRLKKKLTEALYGIEIREIR